MENKFSFVPVFITSYQVHQHTTPIYSLGSYAPIAQQDGSWLVEGKFAANMTQVSELANAQKTLMTNAPMYLTNVADVVSLVTEVSNNLPSYLTSPDPSHRELAQVLAKLKGLGIKHDS